jgi:tRNA(Ile)-lysidine synthase
MASSRKPQPDNGVLEHAGAVIERHVRQGDRVVAGLSGGIDSIVLIDVLRRLARVHRFRLSAIHIDHQLNPKSAQWARFCRNYCKARRVNLRVAKVQVPQVASIEAAARDARYAVFAVQPAAFVALAHNLDDQAETVLLQLLRGAGVKGASAMPELRAPDWRRRINRTDNPEIRGGRNAAILRPLLEVPRSAIEAYARYRRLKWIEDDSNANVDFDRNFLRHRVLPLIAERYPAYRTTLARAGRNFADAAQLVDELAQSDAEFSVDGLKLGAVRRLSLSRAKNMLRFFFTRQGVAMPSAARLNECVRQLQRPRTAQITVDLGTHELRCFGDEARVIAKALPPLPGFCRQWGGEARMAIPELGATITMKKSRGRGISRTKLSAGLVTVRLRKGGERLRPDAKRPRRTLKNLLQEARLPMWQRDRLPLLYCGEALVYVPGIGIDSAFRAHQGEPSIEPGWTTDR